MRSTSFHGPNSVVNEALRRVEVTLFFEANEATSKAHDELSALEERINKGEESSDHDFLLRIWSDLTHGLNGAIERSYRAFFDIGFASPGYVSSNPARWASELLTPHVNDLMKQADSWFIPTYAALLRDSEETRASMLTEFYVEITNRISRLEGQAVIDLARRGWKGPRQDDALIAPESKTEERKSQLEAAAKPVQVLKFGLSDLEDPPDGISKSEIVRYLHQQLKPAIKEARNWIAEPNREISLEELSNRFPALRGANETDLQRIKTAAKDLTAHQCSIKLMKARMDSVTEDTVIRYLRPMRNETST